MTDNNVKKTRFSGLELGENGQVHLKSDEVSESELLTPGTGQSGGEFNGGGELQAQFAKLQAENSGLTSQLGAVNLLAEGLEAGVLNPVDGNGPALRIHQALGGLQESMQRLAQERDEARDELAELKKNQNADPLVELTAAQLKEQLDAKGIAYKSGDLKPELLALLKAAQ